MSSSIEGGRSPRGLRTSVGYLAAAGLVEYGLQILLPIVLVRYLDPGEFADYRLLWLLAATGLAIAPFFLPQALFTFVPGATVEERRVLVGNTMLFVTVAGALTGIGFSAWNPMLPSLVRSLGQYAPAGSFFLALWIIGSLLDVLPTVDGRARLQAAATIGIAMIRTALLGCAAVMTGSVQVVIWAMCLTAILKVVVLCYYTFQVTPGGSVSGVRLWGLVRYALPFAIANALFLLRVQADQWVVVGMLSAKDFAIISIASVVIPLSNLVRQPINNSLLPQIAKSLGRNDKESAIQLMSRGYLTTGIVLLPLLGLIFVSADQLVEIVYTSQYRDAAPIMRVYLIGQVATAFASGHLLPVFQKGRESATISAVCLVATVVVGLLCVPFLGLIGAAIGSTVTLLLGEAWAVWVVVRTLGVPAARVLNVGVFVRSLVAVAAAVMALHVVQKYEMDLHVSAQVILHSVTYVLIWLLSCRVLGLESVIRGVVGRRHV